MNSQQSEKTKVYIPSKEISKPSFHADPLGFVFVWKGHLLRGIYRESVEQAIEYFDSGFINEICNKGLFPKTWISEFENEQFGLILEHTFIQPVLYATEWNRIMLRDAALMVLEIAKIAWKYGYTMIDCHKLNVMFENNRPVYVDLGSFVKRQKGVKGWRPYLSFLRSYFYILNCWFNGCEQIAKRMMQPHLEMEVKDYLCWKAPFWRSHGKLLNAKINYQRQIHNVKSVPDKEFQEEIAKKSTIARLFAQVLRKISSNNFPKKFDSLKKLITKQSCKYNIQLPKFKTQNVTVALRIISPNISSATIFDGYIDESILSNKNHIPLISIHRNEKDSIDEYERCKAFGGGGKITTAHFNYVVPFLIKGKFPEPRLISDIVILPNLSYDGTKFAIHNMMLLIEKCISYSSSGKIVICVKGDSSSFIEKLKQSEYSLLRQENIDGQLFVVLSNNK